MGTKEEQDYFRKFYEGTFLIKGWKDRMREILKDIPEGDQAETADRLEKLGEKIGREWARENAVRKVDTPMLQKWGDRLKAARRRGSEGMIAEIGKIESEWKRFWHNKGYDK
jgi:cyclopropane fatty-acyl-phospholipid synthase-like methyltransferase